MILTAELDEPIRLDNYLAERLDCTRSQIKVVNDEGGILVEGKAGKAGRMLKGGESIELLRMPGEQVVDVVAEDIPLEVVYEDEHIAVINKPRGMIVHPAQGVYTGTLVNALLFRFHSLSTANDTLRPGIVHRIDKLTTGLLVVAKNNAAHAHLAEQIAKKSAHRQYLALVEGNVKQDTTHVVTRIARSPLDRKKMAVTTQECGKLADTTFEVAVRYGSHTLLRCTLGTGRTHQIRVHAAHIAHPVAGDPVYGYRTPTVRADGQLLHAYHLSLTHPVTGKRMEFFAPLPSDFRAVLSRLNETDRTPIAGEIEDYL